MSKGSEWFSLAAVNLDREGTEALHKQLYYQLSQAILSRRLVAGTRLPSTRAMAADLAISRNTVITAFEQLLADGYIEGRIGDGTYVSRSLSEDLLTSHTHAKTTMGEKPLRAQLSKRGETIVAALPDIWKDRRERPRIFRVGLPAYDEFPFDIWRQLTAKRLRSLPNSVLMYDEPAGYGPLREAVATYVGASRGVRCEPEQVIIISGSQSALDLAAQFLLDPGDAVWIEEPGYIGARTVLRAAGARLVPVPVDKDGIDVEAGIRREVNAKLAYVTPSNQFPLGTTMSLSRRLELLEWAATKNAWILEDDYDSEYRYEGRPLTALQGMDNYDRVIYIGTFSKVLTPAFRLGYAIVPPSLVDAFTFAQLIGSRRSATLMQATMCDFISDGHFARHIQRTRALYMQRRAALVQAIASTLSGVLEVTSGNAGLHVLARLPEGMDDKEISRQAAKLGIEAFALSHIALEPLSRGGLLLGYGAVTTKESQEGVHLLKTAIAAQYGKRYA